MKTSLPLSLLLGFGVATIAWSADSNTNKTPVAETPQPYTDRGTTTTTVTTTSDYFNSSNHSGFGTFGPDFSSHSSTISIRHRPIYFPPEPPPLGEAVFKRQMRVSLAKLAPPSALAEDIYEPFYAPLSTLLFTEDLSRKRRERLDGYHSSRASLLTEIHTLLDSLQTSDAPTRESSLAALAREQAPRFAALENAAEDLRHNFTEGGFFDSRVHWNDTRDWRLGDDTRWESSLDEIKVMRGAAAFQEGLSAAQRRLLRELAMELSDGLKGPTSEIDLSAPGPYMYFSPETSRIRLPAEMPEELIAKIEAYKAEKTALKQELRDVIYQKDRAFFESTRINALKALAEKQTGRFAAVEQLAEEIRRGLAPLPNPARPPGLPLPAPLGARLTKYNRDKSYLQRLLMTKLDEIKGALPGDRVEFIRMNDVFFLNVVASRHSTVPNEQRQAIVESLAAFNRHQTKLYSTLAREKEAIGIELTHAAKDMAGSKSIDQLLREFTYSLKKQEAWDLYHDYEIAVLEPGLSPAQRVLLFGAALQKLDLPLKN